MWAILLNMLGKGQPTIGDSYTQLQCNALPGQVRTFDAKTAVGATPGIMYYLKWIARIG